MGDQPEYQQGNEQNDRRNTLRPSDVADQMTGPDLAEGLSGLPEESPGNGAESVDRRDHDAGECQHENQGLPLPDTGEDREFTPEVCKSRKPDACEHRGHEEPAKNGSFLPKSAHFIEVEGAAPVLNRCGKMEKCGDRESVRQHEEDRASGTQHADSCDAEENVTHVHDRCVGDHLLEIPLRHGDQPDDDDVP